MVYVVIGASAAGVNGVRELRKLKPEDEIILISQDECIYSRCILHHYLAGIRTIPELNFTEADFAEKYRVNWHKGVACTAVDTAAKTLTLADGSAVSYDKLLIAAGAHVFIPPIKGIEGVENVLGFRNLEDVEELKEKSKGARNIVIMGGGLVGIDALTGLLENGHKPVMVELADRLLVKQLDAKCASAYQKAYQKKGAKFYLGIGIDEVKSDSHGKVSGVVLSNGQELPCDLLLMTAGVRANVEFLAGSGIVTDRFGLQIDERGQTNVPDVYGAGDVTGKSPIWSAAVKQGLIAAANMAGEMREMTDFFASKSTMNFLGIPTMSLGINEVPDDSYTEVIAEDGDNYQKIIHKDGKIYGALLQGNLSYAGVLTQLIARNIDVSRIRKPLFRIDYSDFFREDDNYEFYYEEA